MCRKLIYVMTFVLALGSTANAALYLWNGSAGDGNWDTALNWTVTDSLWTWPNEEYGNRQVNSDTIAIDILNGDAVTRSGQLGIDGAADGSTTGVLTLNNGSSLTVGDDLATGTDPGRRGQIDVLGGSTVTVVGDGNDIRIADDPDTWGMMNIVDSTVNISDDLRIDEGEGYVNISGSSIVNADAFNVADNATGVSYLDISGTALITLVDDFKIDEGIGTITIGGDAVISFGDDCYIPDKSGEGTMTLSGNSVFNVGDDMTIADDADTVGHVIVTGNATLNAPDELYLADANTAFATLDVNGTATVNVGDDLDVGEDGAAVCNIGENAIVTVADTIYIGHNEQGIEARMTISGNASVTCNDLQVVNDGGNTGYLHISGNATIIANEFLMNNDAGNPGTSEVIMDGGTVTVNGNSTINDDNPGTATFTMNGGSFYSSGYLNVSDNLDGIAHLTINDGEMITGNRLRLGKDDGVDIGQVRIFMNGGLLQAEGLDIQITDTKIIFTGGVIRIRQPFQPDPVGDPAALWGLSEADMQILIDIGTIEVTGVYTITTDGDYTVLSLAPVEPPVEPPIEPPAIGGANILFVASMTAEGDDALKAFMEGLGHTVTYIDDDEDEATTEAAAIAADLVFVSESCGSNGIKNEITELAVPMIVGEPYAWDEMGLTEGGGGDTAAATTDIDIVDPGHYMAAGLSGTVAVLTDITSALGKCNLGKGITGPEATVIATATLSDGVTYDVIFVYEKGAALAVAPADGSPQVAADIRIGFGFHANCTPVLTDNAYALLGAAIDYALGQAAPPEPEPTPPEPEPTPPTPVEPVVLEIRVAAGEDDVEEHFLEGGTMEINSSDLEITEEGGPEDNQYVGVRFNNVDVPQGAIITSAYVQFHVDEVDVPGDNRPGTKFLRGEAVDNAAAFSDTAFDVSIRPTTTAEATWDWPLWLTEHEEGPDQQTSDISTVIQEIVDRPGWAAGNSLALIITGSGENCAEAFEGEADAAPLLHIEYVVGEAPTPPEPEPTPPEPEPTPPEPEPTPPEPEPTPGLIERRISAGSDDAEERDYDDGFEVEVDSSDLELAYEDENQGDPQVVGLRFTDITIPKGTKIKEAWVQFEVDETKGGTSPVYLAIYGELSPNAATFSKAACDITSRPRTTTSTSLIVQQHTYPSGVLWHVPNWTVKGDQGPAQRTPDIADIIEEIVDQDGWVSGNSLVLIFDHSRLISTGVRCAESFEGKAEAAPLLYIKHAVK